MGDYPGVRRFGRQWVFSDGTRLPVVSGGADDSAETPGLELPDDLTSLSPEELEALETSGIEQVDALVDGEDTVDLELLTGLADAIDAVRAERARRVSEAEEGAARVSEILARVHPETEPTEPVEQEPAEPAAEATEETPAEGEDPTLFEAPAEEQPAELVAVPASSAPSRGRYVNLALLRREGQPSMPAAETTPSGPEWLVAADVPGHSHNMVLNNSRQLALAAHARARGLQDHSNPVVVASVQLPIPRENWLTGDPENDEEIFARVSNPAALTAAGGWCAPSDNIYEFFSLESADGGIDLPTVRVTRAGISWPDTPTLGDVAGALWSWTEQDDIDAATAGAPDPTKPCLRVPCPTWNEARLTTDGVCLTHGNLADRAFPELTRRIVDLALIAHAHKMSATRINAISTASTKVNMSTDVSDTVGNLGSAIGLQVEDYRNKFRMSPSATLEAVFPAWAKEALRADLAMRAGVSEWNVSDAEITSFFTNRNVRAQFVTDYGTDLGNASPATTWPASIKFLLYAAGTFVVGDGGQLDLGVVRDSVLNSTNDFTALWTEQFHLLAQRGPESREITVPTSLDGVTACCP